MPDADPASTTSSATGSAHGLDLSGRQFGNYRLLRRLGQGAMAEVYLAEQTSLRRQIAMKVLKSHLAEDETFVKRFHHEAQAAASLTHANLVQIHEVGCVDGIHFIAQEYVQGKNLAELVARKGPLDLKVAMVIIRQAASALYKAGEQGIVHRDIKPENIMFSADGVVKVADFGLARLTRDETAPHLTQVGVTMGTPLYMSPEQVEGRTLDPRSDIYSLGVTCYYMLVGQTPFTGETALAVAVQHVKQPPERLENRRPDLPGAVCRIVHKMLEKRPDDRYQDARELLADLRSLQVDGLEDDWAKDLDDWIGPEMMSLLDARTAATQQLDSLMKSTTLQTTQTKRRGLNVLGLFASLLAGGIAAWSMREESLLAGARPREVPKQATAEEQFTYAALAGTEAAWKSIEGYFPEATELMYRADVELAIHYLQRDDDHRAGEIFDEYASYDEIEQEAKRAFGIAGQCILFSMREQTEQFARCLSELEAMDEQSLDPRMKSLVEGELRRNQGASAAALEEFQRRRKESPDTD